jgi:hypothetical protein
MRAAVLGADCVHSCVRELQIAFQGYATRESGSLADVRTTGYVLARSGQVAIPAQIAGTR